MLIHKVEALFRVVPPSIYLALGMTEKHEKAERKQLMTKHKISELDAALMVAKNIDGFRGVGDVNFSVKVGHNESAQTVKKYITLCI